MEYSVKDAEELYKIIDRDLDDVPTWKKDKFDCFESWEKTSASIIEKIRVAKTCTPGQYRALNNISLGIKKWLDD